MSETNADQKLYWEGAAAKWIDRQEVLDTTFAPILDKLIERAALTIGMRVLDIGCGTGAGTRRAAEAVGPSGTVLGIDISEPMLARARILLKDSPNLRLLTADAASYPFPSAGFDAAMSRFGVMFFEDTVAAFANIRGAMRPGARITMAAWSSLETNPWFQVPTRAARRRLGAPPKLDPDAPGPLAFRDITRVCGFLKAAGFKAVAGHAVDLHLTPPGDLEDVAAHAASIGPASRAMAHFEGTEADFEAIAADVAEAFAGYQTAAGIRVPAQINFFEAEAPEA